MRRALYLLPVILFMTLVGYFALALRPDHDPHELPSALIDKEAPLFALPGLYLLLTGGSSGTSPAPSVQEPEPIPAPVPIPS